MATVEYVTRRGRFTGVESRQPFGWETLLGWSAQGRRVMKGERPTMMHCNNRVASVIQDDGTIDPVFIAHAIPMYALGQTVAV